MPPLRNVQHESCKFYLGRNEDYSPGDRISDNSEKLPKEVGEGQYVCDFGEHGVQATKQSLQKFLLVTGAVFTMQDFRAL